MELCAASLDKYYLEEGNANKYSGPMLPVKDMLLELAHGLEYIHKMGLAHRDLKPENALIWVGSAHKVQIVMKWADFGLSKRRIAEKERFHWLAPELLKMYTISNDGSSALYKTGDLGELKENDVFAAGLTFAYILLAGKHPYGNNSDEIIENLTRNEPLDLKGNW